MVATRSWVALSVMTPGVHSMLRARRKDKDIRPNRFLDRTSSRGMLYENEGLRLRTINISADLEKGQQYIKKLQRENSQLRREIWNLRDQYDRLESFMVRNQDQEQVMADTIEGCNCESAMLSSVAEECEHEDVKADGAHEPAAENSENGRHKEQSTDSQPYDQQLLDMTQQFGNLNPVLQVVTVATPMQNDKLKAKELQSKLGRHTLVELRSLTARCTLGLPLESKLKGRSYVCQMENLDANGSECTFQNI